jgi:hypothetical protein
MYWAARGYLLEANIMIIGYIFCEAITSDMLQVNF